jgi:hypothetical protein
MVAVDGRKTNSPTRRRKSAIVQGLTGRRLFDVLAPNSCPKTFGAGRAVAVHCRFRAGFRTVARPGRAPKGEHVVVEAFRNADGVGTAAFFLEDLDGIVSDFEQTGPGKPLPSGS